jgi:hypothetical protein
MDVKHFFITRRSECKILHLTRKPLTIKLKLQ